MAKKINFDENILVEYINNCKKESGYYPKYEDFKVQNGSPYSRTVIEKIYGDIDNLYKAIGIKRENIYKSKINEYKLKQYIQSFYDMNNKYPRVIDFRNDENSPYSFSMIEKKYKTLASCYDKLGFIDHDTLVRNIELDELKLTEFIENYKQENGFVPALNKFYISKGSPYSKGVILNYYGSVNEMYRKLGYELNDTRKTVKISNNKLLEDLLVTIYKYRTTDRDELRQYAPDTIYDRAVYERIFGSWTNAAKEAGFRNENRALMAEYTDYNGEEPIEFLKLKIGKNGEFTEKQNEFILKRKASYTSIKKYFKKNNFFKIIIGERINDISMQPIKMLANDGHICDSNSEKIVDNFLFEKNIKHEVHGKYPNSIREFDFKINNLYIEYAGLYNSTSTKHKDYKNKIKEKIKFAKDNNINLYVLYNINEESLNNLLLWIHKNSSCGFTE